MNRIKPVKKSHIVIAWTAILVCLLCLSLYIVIKFHTTSQKMMIDDINKRIEILEEVVSLERSDLNVSRLREAQPVAELGPVEENYKEFLFTNYGLWDGESGDMTASLIPVWQFTPNDKGIYTYDGHIVLGVGHSAVAPLKQGFTQYELGQVLNIELDGEMTTGIVLDRCGTCTWGKEDEVLQRIDIFTTHQLDNKVGKVYE